MIWDLHVDSIIEQFLFRYDLSKKHKAGILGQPFFWHGDLPRMLEANYAAACMGIHYWPWESERGWRSLNRQIDYLDKIATEQNGCLRIFRSEQWIEAAEQKKLALAPAVEGAHMLNGKIERVAKLAERGVAYLTLTHFSRNVFAVPSIGRGANECDGLTGAGKELVSELNKYGILVDVAHVNRPGVLDVCRISRTPVLCTHTGVRAIHDCARNISDEEIDAIAATGGVIGIIFGPIFLAGKLRANSQIILDHIEYVIKRVGPEHVALGSDYDGWLPSIACDQRDCRDIKVVIEGLIHRGYRQELPLILYQNTLRVLGK